MLIVALVLALIGLGALVMAVVTSNELIAWVCIVASVIGVVLLIVDALRDRSRADADESTSAADDLDESADDVEDYPDEAPIAQQYDDAGYDDGYDDTDYRGTPAGQPGEDAVEAEASAQPRADDDETSKN